MPIFVFLLSIIGLKRALAQRNDLIEGKHSEPASMNEVRQNEHEAQPISPDYPNEEHDTDPEDVQTYLTGLSQGNPEEEFNISMKLAEDLLPETKEIFTAVGEYISSIIEEDIPDVRSVDDLTIRVEKAQIDGANGISGQGGVLAVRDVEDTGTPYQAIVRIDVADEERLLANGNMDEIAAHEVLHALGFGTLWEDRDLIDRTDSALPRFTGENAVLAYQEAYSELAASDDLSMQGVPLSPDERHWAEQFYGDLLLPSVSEKSKVTSLTVASLEDLGFETIFDRGNADATIPDFDGIDPPLPIQPIQRSNEPNENEPEKEDEAINNSDGLLVM